MSGRVLTSSALVDIATGSSVYGAAFLAAGMRLGVTMVVPGTSLLAAWARVDAAGRPLLDLLTQSPAIVVEPLDAVVAARAGAGAPADAIEDLESLHVVDVARQRGLTVLTAEPTRLITFAELIDVEALPGT